MNKFFSASPLWQNAGIFLLRIAVGLMLIYHGKEVFEVAKMKEYAGWDMFKSSAILPYIGKGAEFIAGVFLVLGLFTRLTCLLIIGTFIYITFWVGHGKFWMDDQHPFLFAILGLLFFFTGPGALSMDGWFFKSRRRSY